MTAAELDALLAAYAAGMDAELDLLRQLDALSSEQGARLAAPGANFPADTVDERARVMNRLQAAEADLAAVRAIVVAHLEAARARPDFAAVSARHRRAEGTVAAILAADRQTLAGLEARAAERRSLASLLDTGSATLAAYRRIVAPPPTHAAILHEEV